MAITVEATFEHGLLKPKQPLALAEGAEVRLPISPVDDDSDPLAAVIGIGDRRQWPNRRRGQPRPLHLRHAAAMILSRRPAITLSEKGS
jgi:predicted DNA-binding antitoxin AbrB/MazE fold protein